MKGRNRKRFLPVGDASIASIDQKKGEFTMSIFDYNKRKIPEYYKEMYLDDFTPAEILMASRESLLKEIQKKNEPQEIKFTAEIKIK